jgi:hypothetical protein
MLKLRRILSDYFYGDAMFAGKSFLKKTAFALAALLVTTPAIARPISTCLLILGDSTTSFNGSISTLPAYEAAQKGDEWAQSMIGRASVITSPELANDLRYSYPFYMRYADFTTYVAPRTDWVLIENAKDLANYGTNLATLPRIMRAGTHSFKALSWAIDDVKTCPGEKDSLTQYTINFETDGTPSDTRVAGNLRPGGSYFDPLVKALVDGAYEKGVRINALGIAYTTGQRPSDDNFINLQQVMQDNFRTPNGKALVIRVPQEFGDIYRIKLNNDMAQRPDTGDTTQLARLEP